MWLQKEIRLKARPRGFHLIDQEIRAALPELDSIRTGVLHLWLQHTSASLTVNENADPRPSSATGFAPSIPISNKPRQTAKRARKGSIVDAWLGAWMVDVGGCMILFGRWSGVRHWQGCNKIWIPILGVRTC